MRRIQLFLAPLVATAALLTACGGSSGGDSASSTPRDGGTLVVGLYTEPTAIDPHREYFWETFRASRNIYEPLVQEDLSKAEGTPALIPGLATEWTPTDDARTWTFKLREGVKFQDGTDFNAEAVDFNIRRFTDPTFEFYDQRSAGMLKARFSDLKSARVVDPTTYEFTFNQPYLGFPRLLAQSIGSPLIGSPAAFRQYGNDGIADHPVGTGPYSFVERKINDHITLERFTGYWGQRPHLDRLVFRTIENNQSRLAALQTGEIDILTRVQPTDVDLLENQGYSVPAGTGAQLDYVSFLFDNQWAQKPEVRKAIALAIDRKGIADNIYSGQAQPLTSFINPGNEAYSPDLKNYSYDPEKAKQLLQQAGINSGQISFNIIADLAGQPEAEFISDNLKQIGITANVVALERGTYSSRISSPEPEDGFHLGEYGGTYPEWVREGFNSTVVSHGGEPYVDFPAISTALDTARYTSDDAARLDLWRDADKIIAENAAVVPTVNFTKYYAVAPGVHGFIWPQTNWYDLSAVWVDEQ
ncbi:MAG: peptide ABC transporter substrate-binding protein [Gordonia sp.]|nr:peptide ABC transporter substrate-binding protein [Gordonia sp. (in: high G+C Gram-positive bacteria)]